MNYRQLQAEKVMKLFETENIFNGDKGGGDFQGRNYPHILTDNANNLYGPILKTVQNYFADNQIGWWGGSQVTTNPLSSQVACLNHLFPLRQDRKSVLDMVQAIDPEIIEVLELPNDIYQKGYISFEVVSEKDHLNEITQTRGALCTSIDALILGKREDGKRIMFVIEWKYTEFYGNTDNSPGREGKVRKSRYDDLIISSKQLKTQNSKIYYYEPFYQLMRQTLWAEQMICNSGTEKIKADDFMHVHVIPAKNSDLLKKRYICSGLNMEMTWRSCIDDQSKYRIITPKDLLIHIDPVQNNHLLAYLSKRYWD